MTTWRRWCWRRSAPARADGPELRGGDVLVVTQKVVSKAEGRLVPLDHDDPAAKAALVEAESVRVAAPARRPHHQRDPSRVRLRQLRGGPVQCRGGTAALLPVDSDRSARRIRAGIAGGLGRGDRRDRLRHVRPAVASRRDRRRHRVRRGGGGGRPARDGGRRRSGAGGDRGLRGRRDRRCGRARHGQGPRHPGGRRPRRAGGVDARASVSAEVVRTPDEDLFR